MLIRRFGGRLEPQSDPGSEQGLAPPLDIGHDLEEAEIWGSFLLRDPAKGAEPRSQQRPESLSQVGLFYPANSATMIDSMPRLIPAGHSPVPCVPEDAGPYGDVRAAARILG